MFTINIVKTTVTGRFNFDFGRGSRNRTHINGFGDRCTAFVRYPYVGFTDVIRLYTKILKTKIN